MKIIFALMFIAALSLPAAAQAVKGDTTIAKKGLCYTMKRQGVEVYLLTEPVNEYEVTGEVSAGDALAIANALSGTADTRTLTEKVDALVSNAKRKAKKGKFEFDAIITADGSAGSCIKFK